MNARFDYDPLQELTQAIRQATPSIDVYHLSSEAVAARAERINIELEENIFPTEFDAYRANLSRSGRKHPKPDIAKEAQFLAQAQERRDLLHQQRKIQLKQSRIVFFTALILLISGVLLVFAGVVGIYVLNLTVGTITVVSGSIINLISAIVLRFHRQENERLDMITRELSILDRATIAMQYINYISDAKKKDRAIVDLTKQLYTGANEQKGSKTK